MASGRRLSLPTGRATTQAGNNLATINAANAAPMAAAAGSPYDLNSIISELEQLILKINALIGQSTGAAGGGGAASALKGALGAGPIGKQGGSAPSDSRAGASGAGSAGCGCGSPGCGGHSPAQTPTGKPGKGPDKAKNPDQGEAHGHSHGTPNQEPSQDRPTARQETPKPPTSESDPIIGPEVTPEGLPVLGPVGVNVSPESVAWAKANNNTMNGMTPLAKWATARANEYGLKLLEGVGQDTSGGKRYHDKGYSIDVVPKDQPDTVGDVRPEMMAYAREMIELGKAGIKDANGDPLVHWVVYAGKTYGPGFWDEGKPTSKNDVIWGHWNHVHVQTGPQGG